MLLDSYVQRRIVLTLSYSAQFYYPLTLEEIWQRLITDRAVSFQKVSSMVAFLVERKVISQAAGYFYLTTTPIDVSVRITRENISQAKYEESMIFLTIAQKIPWIRAIAITGSVAVHNAKKDDDVDFLIVTAKHTLWLCRLLVICIALYKQKRRSWGREEKNSWCFNMWLEEDTLAMPQRLHTIYGSYEICQTKWIYNSDQRIVETYYRLNKWISTYIGHYYNQVKKTQKVGTLDIKSANMFVAFINYSVYFIQRIYMIPHITQEKVGLSYAFFHPRDTKTVIYNKWREIVKNI